jgi:TPR repeat protein
MCAPVSAFASEWWYVNSGPGSVVFIDAQSIERKKDIVTYWTMHVIRPGEPEVMTKAHMRAECGKRRLQMLTILRFDETGRSIGVAPSRSSPMQSIAPDTLGDAELRFACGDEGHRVANDLFPMAINEVKFAEALIVRGNKPGDANGIHEAMMRSATASRSPIQDNVREVVKVASSPAKLAPAALDTTAEDAAEIRQFEQACTGGDTDSCTSLGIAFHTGTGIPADPSRAAAAFARACELGGPADCGNLGLGLVNGDGIARDVARAFSYFTAACEHGNAASCSSLGASYSMGIGVKVDARRAMRLFKRACEGDDAGGCYNLGVVYDQGLGVKKDPARAATLYTSACDRDNSAACGNLGTLMQNGSGVAKDVVRAGELLRKACDLADADGCLNLGRAYQAGSGVMRDLVRAQAYFIRALAIEPNKADARRALGTLLPE